MRKRALIAAALIVAYLILAFVEFHREIIAPIFCIAIALVMFWPQPKNNNDEPVSAANQNDLPGESAPETDPVNPPRA